MKDFLGREITVGCTVIYPVRRGSKMWLARMNVTQTSGGVISGYNAAERRVTVSCLENVVVVDLPTPAVE